MVACYPEPITTAESQGITLVLVLVVVLGRFFVEDEHDDEDDFQERVHLNLLQGHDQRMKTPSSSRRCPPVPVCYSSFFTGR